jgi:hypothetical protein
MSQHKIRTVRVYDRDLGAEEEYEITFSFTPGSPDTYDKSRGGPGGWDPGYSAEVEFVSISPGASDVGAFTDLAQRDLEDWADNWLQDDGYDEALAVVAADDERGREYAAELRADR